MTKTYSIEVKDRITFIRYTEKPTLSDIRKSMQEAARMDRNGLRLWDFSCGIENYSIDQLREVAAYGKGQFIIPSKVAVVAQHDFAYGLLRTYEIFREQEQVVFMVFREEKEALAWLENPAENRPL